MGAWIAAAWGQVWPNLVANVLWVPVAAWWAHSRARRHVEQVERLLEQHRRELHLYVGDKPGPG